jgi:hypothetical protein
MELRAERIKMYNAIVAFLDKEYSNTIKSGLWQPNDLSIRNSTEDAKKQIQAVIGILEVKASSSGEVGKAYKHEVVILKA